MGIYNLEDAMEKCSPFATNVPFVEVKYDKCGNVVSKTAHNMENVSIPEFEQKQLSRYILKACRAFYSNPENVKKYEKWKAEREENKLKEV